MRPAILPALAAIALAAPSLSAKDYAFDCELDPLLDIPACFASLTPDALEQAYPAIEGFKEGGPTYFTWLTEDRSRAHFRRRPYSNVEIKLALFGGAVPVEEAIVDFQEGKLVGITFSIYNRGDSGSISSDELKVHFQECGKQLGQRLSVRPFSKKANPTQGLLTEGYTWISEKGMAILEHNPEALSGRPEFLRMRVMRRDAKGPLAAAMQARSGAAVKLSQLPANVATDQDRNVSIQGMPMVDQGDKGYCVVASAQRVFEYYGIPCDMHQLAQIAGSDAARGTNPVAMAEGLQKIVYRFKTRFKILCLTYSDGKLHEVGRDLEGKDVFLLKDFSKEVRRYIDDGIPLLWSLQLGKFPEEPAISPQASGGHMRLITGYNDETGHIVFSDSWGRGHEKKRMKESDAYRATTGLFTLQPTVR